MVQQLSQKANAQWEVHAQDNEGDDEHKVKKVDGEVLSRDASSSWGSEKLCQMEIQLIIFIITNISIKNMKDFNQFLDQQDSKQIKHYSSHIKPTNTHSHIEP